MCDVQWIVLKDSLKNQPDKKVIFIRCSATDQNPNHEYLQTVKNSAYNSDVVETDKSVINKNNEHNKKSRPSRLLPHGLLYILVN